MGETFTHDPSPAKKSGTLGLTIERSEIAEHRLKDTNLESSKKN